MKNNQENFDSLKTEYSSLKSFYSKLQTEKRLLEEDRDKMKKKFHPNFEPTSFKRRGSS